VEGMRGAHSAVVHPAGGCARAGVVLTRTMVRTMVRRDRIFYGTLTFCFRNATCLGLDSSNVARPTGRGLRIQPLMSRLDPDRWEALSLYLDQALQVPEETRSAWLAALREQNPSLAADLNVAVVLLEHRTLIDQFLGRGESTTAGGVSTATQTHWVPGAPIGLARSGNFEDDFAGTDRFAVIRRLGADGMGVVYEVHDRARHEVVALKTLRRPTPAGIYRLKREFRSLAGMSHPHVVGLYELFIEDSRCFFTMELVRGVTFVDYVRHGSEGRASIARLTDALQQLIVGVSAL